MVNIRVYIDYPLDANGVKNIGVRERVLISWLRQNLDSPGETFTLDLQTGCICVSLEETTLVQLLLSVNLEHTRVIREQT